jgi:hypothetical protein
MSTSIKWALLTSSNGAYIREVSLQFNIFILDIFIFDILISYFALIKDNYYGFLYLLNWKSKNKITENWKLKGVWGTEIGELFWRGWDAGGSWYLRWLEVALIAERKKRKLMKTNSIEKNTYPSTLSVFIHIFCTICR